MNKKIFKIDKTGKSTAFFLNETKLLKNKHISELKKIALENNDDQRICLHTNKKSSLQIMINCLFRKKEYSPHKHFTKDEFYYLLNGRLKIILINKTKKITNFRILDSKNRFFFLTKNIIHYTIPLTKTCIFVEARPGPFEKKDTKIYKFLKKF
jgi:cupin fold WbuC family metalloprotein